MTLLIDGHNLIGAGVFRDITLRDVDDEAKLVARLKIWRSRIRRNIVVFFDRGIPGGRDHRMSGAGVEVIFAANPTEADDLIRRRLENANRQTVLVSNDDALARSAEAYGVERWRGAEFVARMAMRLPDLPTAEAGEEWDVRLSPKEVEEWLAVFREARRARLAKRKAAQAQPPNGKFARANLRVDTSTPVRRRATGTISLKQEMEQAALELELAAQKKAQKLAKKGSSPEEAASKKPVKQSRRKARKAARERNRPRPASDEE